MSNRPDTGWPVFRDSSGNALAAGTIEFTVNNDPNTQITIYSDAALTTPAINPYTLNANGAIEGDVFYEGIASYVLKDSAAAAIRTVNDVTANAVVVAASTSAAGVVELATNAEHVTGTAATLAATPDGLTARLEAPGPIGGTTPGSLAATTITTSGDITLTGANVVVGSGQGINFAATADGTTMSSELLDDYEVGTFTPTLADSSLDGTGESQSYGTRSGRYIKIGRMVFFQIKLTVNSVGSLTAGQFAHIMGLPFTAVTNASGDAGGANATHAQSVSIVATGNIVGRVLSNTSYVQLWLWDGTGGPTALLISEMTIGQVTLNGSYEVA